MTSMHIMTPTVTLAKITKPTQIIMKLIKLPPVESSPLFTVNPKNTVASCE